MEGPLQLFFSKYEHLKAPNESIRKAFAEAVFEVVGAPVDISQVSFKNGTIYLLSDPYIKNGVLINKDKITSILESKIGKKPDRIR